MNESVIFIHGGGLIKINGIWKSIDLNDAIPPDNAGGSVGGTTRVVACSYLYKEKPCLIISSGGRNKYYKSINSPNISSVMKDELVALGVNKNDIIESPRPQNTYQEILYLKKIVEKKNIHKIIVISNKYHLPRIKFLAAYDPSGKRLDQLVKLQYISSEKILSKHDPKMWNPKIDKAYKSKWMLDIIKKEKMGVKQIKLGTYKFI